MLINRIFHSFIYRVSAAFWVFEIQSLNVGQRHLNESIFGNAKRNNSCFDRSSVCSVEWFTQPHRTNSTQIVYLIVDSRVCGSINENWNIPFEKAFNSFAKAILFFFLSFNREKSICGNCYQYVLPNGGMHLKKIENTYIFTIEYHVALWILNKAGSGFQGFFLHFRIFPQFFPYFHFVLIFSLFLQHFSIEFKSSDRTNAKHDGIDVHNRVHFM